MGQDFSRYPPDQGLQPGTYRIISGTADQAIEVSTYDHNNMMTWSIHEGKNQQWILRRSGDGYRFKNRRYGSFLSVVGTSGSAYPSKFPTTWVLRASGDYHLIEYPDSKQVLSPQSSRVNGTKIYMTEGDSYGASGKIWKLQYLSNYTDEVLIEECEGEVKRLKQELIARDAVISKMDEALTQLNKKLANKEHDLSEKLGLLYQRGQTIDQLEKELDEMFETDAQVRIMKAAIQIMESRQLEHPVNPSGYEERLHTDL